MTGARLGSKSISEEQILPASAQFEFRPVENAEAYQTLYAALDESLFLERFANAHRTVPA